MITIKNKATGAEHTINEKQWDKMKEAKTGDKTTVADKFTVVTTNLQTAVRKPFVPKELANNQNEKPKEAAKEKLPTTVKKKAVKKN